jgi:hypothetical protein
LEDRLLPANTLHWIGGNLAGNKWSIPGNWKENLAPQAGDNVIFDSNSQTASIADPSNVGLASFTMNGYTHIIYLRLSNISFSGASSMTGGTVDGLNANLSFTFTGSLTLGGSKFQDKAQLILATGSQTTVNGSTTTFETSSLSNSGMITWSSGNSIALTQTGSLTNQRGGNINIKCRRQHCGRWDGDQRVEFRNDYPERRSMHDFIE